MSSWLGTGDYGAPPGGERLQKQVLNLHSVGVEPTTALSLQPVLRGSHLCETVVGIGGMMGIPPPPFQFGHTAGGVEDAYMGGGGGIRKRQ